MDNIEQRLEKTEEELNKARKELKQLSPALELVQDLKKQKLEILSVAKMVFTYAIIMTLMFGGLLAYTIWFINDTQVIETTEEYTQDIDDVGDISNSNIVNNGDINGEG